MSIELKKETFKPLLNTTFKITFDEENSYEVELIEIIEHSPIASLSIEPFTLVFRGDRTEKIFMQRLYNVFSEPIGEVVLFLVPRQPDEKGVYYDCVVG